MTGPRGRPAYSRLAHTSHAESPLPTHAQPDASEAVDADFIGFNSKVVSRKHAEIWSENNEFFIRDTKSQSGTFLNAMRLSLPGEESKPFKIKNGDAIQFGVDRRGTDDDNMKCVAFTVELSFRKASGGGAW